jgi:hypothetical protein
VGVSGVGIGEESQPGSSRTLNRSPSADDKFWVPPNLKRQASVCHSENADTSGGKCSGIVCTKDHVSCSSVQLVFRA